ncbi:MAG: flagellar FliJ family protein [Treponema sp.]|nr:flagellar FliJ family protein [Treponema sp.]
MLKRKAEAELGKAVSEETKIKDTLELVARERVQTIQYADTLNDLSSLAKMNQYLLALDSKKEMLLEQLAEAKLVTEQKRKLMQEALNKVRALEKLRDSQQAEWKKQMQKAEAKEVDDIINSRYR